MSKTTFGMRYRDQRVVDLVYVTLVHLQIPFAKAIVDKVGKFKRLTYSSDGLNCEVRLPGIVADVEITDTSAMADAFAEVKFIRYLVDSENNLWDCTNQIPEMSFEAAGKSRQYAVEAELSMCSDRMNYVLYALSKLFSFEIASSTVESIFMYPFTYTAEDVLYMEFNIHRYDPDHFIRSIEVAFDHSSGYKYVKIYRSDGELIKPLNDK